MPRVPAGMAASTGMVVVATLAAQTVLVVVRFTALAWPGALRLAKDVVITLRVAAQHAQVPSFAVFCATVKNPGAVAVIVLLHGFTATPL